MSADVVRGLFPTALAVAVRDVAFDASDYPMAVGIICAARGETEAMDPASFSARAAIEAGATAGAPLPASESEAQASDAELRCFARVALGQLEVVWLHAGM